MSNQSPAGAAIWSLFADWCLAMGESALPAAPLTLARFLAGNPAVVRTQRRRVGVINAVHRDAGLAAPGNAEMVRELLDARRRRQRRGRTAAAAVAIAMLPRGKGWPTALFARRDAMILVLAGAGVTAPGIAALRMGDIREADRAETLRVHVGAETLAVRTDSAVAGVPATRIWREWDEVRRVQHQLPATRWSRWLFEDKPMPDLRQAPAELPLLTPLDRWGAAPLDPTPLSAAAVSGIVTAHLRGRPALHPELAPKPRVAEPELGGGGASEEPVLLDPAVVERGVQARRRAAELLADVDDDLDEVESRAEALLAGLLELLEEPNLPRDG